MTAARMLSVAIGVFVAGLAAAAALLPVAAWLDALGTSLRGAGLPGAMLFVLVYVAGVTLFVPAWTFSIAAGLLYGVWGIPLAWFAMMVAACVALPLTRALGRPVRSAIGRRRRLRRVAGAIDREGWRMVLLVRVSGIVPFGVQNCVFGITRIRLLPYGAATAVGVLPGVLLHAGAGAFGQATLAGPEAGAVRVAVLGTSVLAALALVFLTVRRIRARLG